MSGLKEPDKEESARYVRTIRSQTRRRVRDMSGIKEPDKEESARYVWN